MKRLLGASGLLLSASLYGLASTSVQAETAQTLDEVVVEATTETPPDTPLTTTVSLHDNDHPPPDPDGSGVLKQFAGISTARKGGSGGEVLFRGQGGSRLPILMDGTVLNGSCDGRIDASPTYIFPDSYDRIVLTKGPQSVRYGSSMAGTVRFERTPLRYDAFTAYADIGGFYGSFNRYDLFADTAVGGDVGSIRGIFSRAASDDYRDGRGDKVHSRYSRNSGTVLAAITPDADTLVQLGLDYGNGEAAYAAGNSDLRDFKRTGVNLTVIKERLSPLLTRLETKVWYNRVEETEDNFSMRPPPPPGKFFLNNHDRANSGGRIEAELSPRADVSVLTGINFDYDQQRFRGEDGLGSAAEAEAILSTPLQNMFRFITWGGFAEATWSLRDDQRLVAGYRYGLVQTDRAALQHDHGGGHVHDAGAASAVDVLHSGFLRYEQDIKPWDFPLTVYAGLGHAERGPDFWERSKRFDLKKERNTQIDWGLKHSGRDTSLDLSLFASEVRDYILVNWKEPDESRNITARLLGGEVQGSYRFQPHWTVRGGLAYTWGTDVTRHRPLAQVPPLDSRVSLDYDDSEFFGSLSMRAVSSQNRIDPGWGNIVGADLPSGTGGFTVWSAQVGWSPRDGIRLSAGVDNLFDKVYAEHLSPGNAGMSFGGYNPSVRVNEAGRTFWLKGQIRF